MANTMAEVPAAPIQTGVVGNEAILFLPDPDRSGQQFTSRKTTYKVGEITTFSFKDKDGNEQTGYLDLTKGHGDDAVPDKDKAAIRLIRLSGRIQESNGINKLIMTFGIVLDNEVVGMVDSDGNYVPHPMYTESRYSPWQNRTLRPHRVNAQQWVIMEQNGQLVLDAVNHCHSVHGWQIIKNPAKSQQRETRDLFVARPLPPVLPEGQVVDPSTQGIRLDAFENSVNPSYAPGFISFYNGVDEQRDRWENAMKQQNPDVKEAAIKALGQNIHFLGGVYHEPGTARIWGRPVDVGAYDMDQQHFAFYEAKGTGPLGDDLFASYVEANKTKDATPQGAAPTSSDLDIGSPLTGF